MEDCRSDGDRSKMSGYGRHIFLLMRPVILSIQRPSREVGLELGA
jgi:hypothetical protein